MTTRARRRRIDATLHENPRAVDAPNHLPDVDAPRVLDFVRELTSLLVGEVAPTQPLMLDILNRMKRMHLGALGVDPVDETNVEITVGLNLRGCEAFDRVWGVGLSPSPSVSRKRILDGDEDLQFEQLVRATVSVSTTTIKYES